ncbi:phycocyanin subunit alpha [Candidatus Cyanaurora vandensis]|uniref:phycocyanin subunit alpha n=1 Tax=Candidatus Cyanaurora vandensis TaxID=2714958 RepID=UPI00257984E8|nr:phycocyanin subunit alpha [Candidatus Cyanaurora vandensis]
MKTVITGVIAGADSQARFLSGGDLQAVQGRLQRASAGLEAASFITSNHESLTKEAVTGMASKMPYLTQPGGLFNGATNQAKCARDVDYYLRFVSYCLVCGDTGPLDDYAISGLREINRAFSLPASAYIDCLSSIKEKVKSSSLSPQAKTEAALYMDYLVNAMS